ncbi:hypothetical protein MRX96_021737 [Rhipicephalus microplus]
MSVIQLGHSGSSSSKTHRKDEDITKFYTKGEMIWTLFTTSGEMECKVDNVTDTDNKSATFERRFLSKTPRESLHLKGTFTNGRKTLHYETYDAMDVHDARGHNYNSFEELLFTYNDGNCGIFFVASWGRRALPFQQTLLKKS